MVKGVSSTSWASASSSFLISASVMVLIMIEVMKVIVRTYYESFDSLTMLCTENRRWDRREMSLHEASKIMIRKVQMCTIPT
eukprot:scaffold17492_cov89-Skeletonema_dohrnii-CCMP3373.AAC.1